MGLGDFAGYGQLMFDRVLWRYALPFRPHLWLTILTGGVGGLLTVGQAYLLSLADATVGINASLVLEANVISLVLISSERTNAGAKLN